MSAVLVSMASRYSGCLQLWLGATRNSANGDPSARTTPMTCSARGPFMAFAGPETTGFSHTTRVEISELRLMSGRRRRVPVRGLADDSGRMHAASVVVRCPLTPYGSDPLRSSPARPHRLGWDHRRSGRPPRRLQYH